MHSEHKLILYAFKTDIVSDTISVQGFCLGLYMLDLSQLLKGISISPVLVESDNSVTSNQLLIIRMCWTVLNEQCWTLLMCSTQKLSNYQQTWLVWVLIGFSAHAFYLLLLSLIKFLFFVARDVMGIFIAFLVIVS